jgi:beta-1,4-mannosyltransferase
VRVAYYYNMPARRLANDQNNNPYGTLLTEALERRGIGVEFTMAFDEAYLRENRGHIDVLHFNWPHYIYYHNDAEIMARQMHEFVRRMELARELGYKLVWTAHNLYPHNQTHRDLDHQCRLHICRLATAVIVHCHVAANGLRQLFGRTENVFVIPHGNFLGVYSSPFTRDDARARLGIPLDAFVYATLGNIRPYKGIEALVDAFRRLPMQDAWLAISGGSVDRTYLESISQYATGDRIVRRLASPRPPNDDFLGVVEAADVVVQPYLDATTSGVLTLALSWPKPVIGPRLGCLPDMVTPETGILYDPEKDGALYHALTRIRSYDLGKAAQAALRVMSSPQFNWDEIARLTIEAYKA